MSGEETQPSEGEAQGVSSSTHFIFEHKVFSVSGAHFTLTNEKVPVFMVPLGATIGALTFPTLRASFDIPADSRDEQLLKIVESSLKFVKVIRPGESIPRELLDGSASWSVEERHRIIARGRLAVQITSWISGNEIVISDVDQLEQIVEDPKTKARVQEAFSTLAEKLGLPPDRKQEVADRIDAFGHELAYIEALRERYGMVRAILVKIGDLQKIYRLDRSVVEEMAQMRKLFAKPVAQFDNLFLQVDGQTGEILALLKKFDSQVGFTRKMRDELHSMLMDWDDMIAKWQALEVGRSGEAEALLKATYRFLAQRFLQTNVWKRS